MKKIQPVSESRKVRKPLMEKKRRARINDSLEALKQILLESKTTLKESRGKNGQRTAKLEKADILEMTVSYLQHLHNRLNQTKVSCEKNVTVRSADSSSCLTLMPTKLNSGEIVYFVPNGLRMNQAGKFGKENCGVDAERVWRPW
ncbi:hypothetical protein NQ317_012163 [Molorchus minor]|uniref:BHLH domain-containing protein n=1 Tax=Molorchus minor TaxID=1323400 RepID=A0ABQ9K4J1_9CUCU|nr:hypothetical protein NQ317_012163 [Molorchus minor]